MWLATAEYAKKPFLILLVRRRSLKLPPHDIFLKSLRSKIISPFFLFSFSGNSVIVWKQTNRIISAGERLIRMDPRMKLIRQQNGVSLHINAVTPEDRGMFV